MNIKIKPYKVGSINPSDITIVFTKGNHDDLMIFDGLDGEIAHSFPLNDYETLFRGHIHLDDEEDWSESDNASSRFDFFLLLNERSDVDFFTSFFDFFLILNFETI